ncbi:MAG: ribonuclease, partial [Ramlibacter sp.]|nr:ribonuclease [Ramlibacter sp.]
MSETKPFSTCDQCDPHRDGVPTGFAVLPPLFRDFGALKRFSGQVVTVKCHEDNTSVRATLETPGEGRVLVVAGGGSLRTALVGGNIGVLA